MAAPPRKGTAYAGNVMNHTSTFSRAPRLGKYLGISLFTAGAICLFDPFISVLDLLPDALGYLLMLLGLYRLADLDDRLMEAAKGLRYLALIGVVRFFSLFLAFGLVSPTEQPVFVLLILFTLGVLDCIVFIPMWKNFCGGILYLGSRNNATTMFDRRGLGGRTLTYNAVERYTAVTTVFFILREALVILPEVTVLSHEKGGVEVGEATHFYDFVGLYRMIGVSASLILGILWLILTVCFIRKLKSDTPFFEVLTEKYRSEVLTRGDLFARRSVKRALVCLLVAAVFTIDLYLDGVNLLPDTLAAVFLFLAVMFLRPYTGKNLPALVASVAYGLTSAACSWIQLARANADETAAVPFTDSTHNALQAVSVLLLAVTVILILRVLFGMVKRYTGVRIFRGDISADDTYATQRTEAIHRLIRRKLTVVGILGALTALSTLYFWLGVPAMPALDLDPALALSSKALYSAITTAYQILTDGYWFVDIALGALWIGFIGSATAEISEQMEYASMMRD